MSTAQNQYKDIVRITTHVLQEMKERGEKSLCLRDMIIQWQKSWTLPKLM